MLALEHTRRQQYVDFGFNPEQSTIQAPFPGLAMDSYESADNMNFNFHAMPYSYFENPSMFATAPPSLKHEMSQFHEMPPALISSGSVPSIPSASSSTVGSPYSGPSHTISSQDSFDHPGATYGLGLMPAIAHHDSFSQDLMGVSMEADFALEKLSDSYVGECADLSSSSQRHPPTIPPSHAPFVRDSSCQRASISSCPEELCVNTALDPPTTASRNSANANSLFPCAGLSSPAAEANRSTPIFKSPTTPASAYARNQKTVASPTSSRSFSSSPRPSPATTHPSQVLVHDPTAVPHPQPASHFQSHFFAQSSGNFLPPLESSCSSLLLRLSHLP